MHCTLALFGETSFKNLLVGMICIFYWRTLLGVAFVQHKNRKSADIPDYQECEDYCKNCF